MRKEILLLLCIFLMPLINGYVLIEPSSINISVNKGESSTFTINLTNYHSFDIYELTFSNLSGFSFPQIDIASGTSKQVTFSVNTNYSYSGKIDSLVTFKYRANIPETITTYNLTITNLGINNQTNNYITIRKGDSIQWNNKDDVTHNLQSTDFEYSLSNNATFTRPFNELKTIEYRTVVAGITLFTGTIQVINRTGEYLVSNPSYNFNYQVNLISIPEHTTLNAFISESNYTVEAQNYKEGLLTINNSGLNRAENIKLISIPEWANFDEDDFSLDSNGVKYIKFKIYPELMYTNETNKSYTITLKIKGINTDEYTVNLNVFIPYSNVYGDLSTEEGFVLWMQNVFCPIHPENYLCNTSARDLNTTSRIIYRESEFSINMTGSEWYNLVKVIGQLKDTQDRSENEKVTFESQMLNSLEETRTEINSTAKKVDRFISDQNSWTVSLWVIGFFLSLAGSVLAIILTVNKIKTKEMGIDVYRWRRS